MKKIVLNVLLVMGLISALQLPAKAQPTDPGTDPDVPLDPGSWVLVAAGVGYGVKKWRDAKQKTNKNGENEIAGFIEDRDKINP